MNKREFVNGPLTEILKNADRGVNRVELSSDEKQVAIVYDNGYIKKVDIEGDSHWGIILDVTRAA